MSLFNTGGMSPADIAAVTGNNSNNDGFGGNNGWWIILLLLACNGGWGNNNGNGNSGGGGGSYSQLGYDFPWLLNGQTAINNNTNAGFQNAMLNDNVTSIRDAINGLGSQVNAGFANAETAATARQMADMQNNFALQSQLANCCCENRAGIADLKYTVATENCADRAAVSDGIRDIIANQSANTQRILDQLCNDKIDAKNEKIADLQNQLNMATLRESQVAQNAFIQQGFANEVDQLYNRLSNCPVPTTPVYGRTPIFTCNNGCGCGNNF